MAAKNKSTYICSACGASSLRWCGQCPTCGEWNTMEEAAPVTASTRTVSRPKVTAQHIDDISTAEKPRILTGLGELDRVLGGGIVPGGLTLISGDPGIGKSTLLLQICAQLGKTARVLYISGEESRQQIKLRAERLGVSGVQLSVLCETDMDTVLACFETEKPDIWIIDSIQTMHLEDIASAPGSVTQVRECTAAILHAAKSTNTPTFLVGHVNKDGAIAGPKVMEHIVDCVLYFEGDRQSSYRLLRCVKNRYGSTNEIGVFEMAEAGLREVENPSLMLLSGRPNGVSGTCVTCVIEGTRPLLAEVQGLVTASGFGNPRRMATGFDYNRLALLLAVLEKRSGYLFSNLDTYVNVVGGLFLQEPAADLAVALALISSLKDVPLPEGMVAFGEIGLAGEIRSVSNISLRVSEAARLGFTHILLPHHNLQNITPPPGVTLSGVSSVREAYQML